MRRKPDDITKEQLIDDFKVMIADAEALLKATANQGDEKLDEVRKRAEASIKDVKVKLHEAQAALYDQTRDAALATDTYVHENPWTAISVAAGIGMLFGLLSRRS